MNLRAAQVKIINDYIQSRIAEHERKVRTNANASVGDVVSKSMSEAAILELQGVYKTIDFACEFGEPGGEG